MVDSDDLADQAQVRLRARGEQYGVILAEVAVRACACISTDWTADHLKRSFGCGFSVVQKQQKGLPLHVRRGGALSEGLSVSGYILVAAPTKCLDLGSSEPA